MRRSIVLTAQRATNAPALLIGLRIQNPRNCADAAVKLSYDLTYRPIGFFEPVNFADLTICEVIEGHFLTSVPVVPVFQPQ